MATLALAACSVAADAPPDDAQAASNDHLALAGVCPDTVIIQASWEFEPEQAVAFQMLGEGYEPDANTKSVTGPLVAQGEDTGVDLEIRAGGPAVGFETVSARMYLDEAITIGLAPIDEAIQVSAGQPVIGVMAPLELDPQVILWDPEAHPEWNTIADIGQTDATVVYAESTGAYMRYLVGSGILKESQIDGSFDGSHARFITQGGRDIATQDFITDGPWRLEHGIQEWGRPTQVQLIHDTGYPNYRHAVTVRAGELEESRPCLERLVPIMQQAMVDFNADPAPTIQVVHDVRTRTRLTPDSIERFRYAAETMRDEGIVGNGTVTTDTGGQQPDDVIGNFDLRRVQKLMDILVPLYRGQDIEVPEDLTVEDIVTNEFIDSDISLPPAVAATPAQDAP